MQVSTRIHPTERPPERALALEHRNNPTPKGGTFAVLTAGADTRVITDTDIIAKVPFSNEKDVRVTTERTGES